MHDSCETPPTEIGHMFNPLTLKVLKMINELDGVTLTHDIAEYHLKKGDRGTVVHCYSDNKAYEVEFIGDDGRTTALLTLTDADMLVKILTPIK